MCVNYNIILKNIEGGGCTWRNIFTRAHRMGDLTLREFDSFLKIKLWQFEVIMHVFRPHAYEFDDLLPDFLKTCIVWLKYVLYIILCGFSGKFFLLSVSGMIKLMHF